MGVNYVLSRCISQCRKCSFDNYVPDNILNTEGRVTHTQFQASTIQEERRHQKHILKLHLILAQRWKTKYTQEQVFMSSSSTQWRQEDMLGQ
jgi:hypothetical protein